MHLLVYKNIIIIGDLVETNQWPIGEQLFWSKTRRRLTGLIEDPSETDMSHLRLTYLNGDQHAWSECNMLDWRSTCLVEDPSKTDMLDWRPMIKTYLTSLRFKNCFILHHLFIYVTIGSICKWLMGTISFTCPWCFFFLVFKDKKFQSTS